MSVFDDSLDTWNCRLTVLFLGILGRPITDDERAYLAKALLGKSALKARAPEGPTQSEMEVES